MIPTNGSSLGRAGGRLRRYPGGTENASIFATVRGSIPKRRAASRRLSPSTYTARRTCPYSSTRFIPPPTSAAPRQMGYCCRIFTPVQPVYPAASNEGFSLRCLHQRLPAGYRSAAQLLQDRERRRGTDSPREGRGKDRDSRSEFGGYTALLVRS